MKKEAVLAIEFRHSNTGFKHESPEAFQTECLDIVKDILKQRHDQMEQDGKENIEEYPLPMFINILFEDLSSASAMLWPETPTHKKYLMRGVKEMMRSFEKKKKITDAVLIMEAWMSQIDTKKMKEQYPLRKEMSDEQIQRRIQREFKENKVEKVTKFILEHQTPIFDEAGIMSTTVETEVYDVFEDKILIFNEPLTIAMNKSNKEKISILGAIDDSETGTHQRVNHFALFNPPTQEELDEKAKTNNSVTNYSLKTSIEYLLKLNSHLK